MDNINITPNAGKLINSLRYLTYTNETAIADIVDNSFDANADNVNVFIEDKYIVIVDDGCGMSQDIMKEAIKLGSDTPKEQSCLGKFGMGLVTASISMGRRLEVFSKTIDDNEPSKVVLDLDYIEETNNWVGTSEPADDKEAAILNSLGHGTIVKISQLDSIKAGILPSLTKHLRLVFRNFLTAGKVVTVNGNALTPIDPLNRDLDDTEILLDDDIEVNGENVHVVVANIDTNKSDETTKYNDANHLKVSPATQGFYIVRNNREIAEAQLLGISTRHPSLNRFRCEISYNGDLDDVFGINFTKNHVEISQALRDKISAKVKPLMSLIVNQAKRASEAAAAEKISHNDAETVINKKKALLRAKNTWKETRKKPTTKTVKEQPTEEKKDDKQKQKQDRKNIRKIKPGTRAMAAEIGEADLGEFGPMFECYFDGNKIVIHWNIRHPFHSKVVAKYSEDKNILTPIDLLVYSLAQEYLSMEGDDQQVILEQALEGMSASLRVLLH
jgi:hypothetical protein